MKKIALTIGLSLIPSVAYASDPTGLMLFLVVGLFISAGILGAVIFLLTKSMSSQKLKYLLRIAPFTMLLSPSSAGSVGYIWPAGVVFMAGDIK